MPRAMWRGAISFGLVTIPVAVYPATEEKTLRFHQLHEEDNGRVRYKRVCEIDGEEVPYDEIVKGYEYEKDHYVVVTPEEMDALPVESSRAIDILQFVDVGEIDPMLYRKSYYLVPDEVGAKPYSLLREAMSTGGKVGIAKVSFREKEHLAALRFKDDAFVLETMHWPDEIREFDTGGVDLDRKVRDQEVQMARELIEGMTSPWDPEAFTDDYREALLQIVEAKINGEEIEVMPAEEMPAKVVDLMEALKKSVARAKGGSAPEDAPLKAATSRGRSRPKAKSASKSKAKSGAKKSAAKSKAKRSTAKSPPRKKAVGE